MTREAVLALSDGSIFRGVSVGAYGLAIGEMVFNTAMTGYQEILTDPSYSGQIITFTYPHIGNTGTNETDSESKKIWASGIVIRDLSITASSWKNTLSLEKYLSSSGIVAISEIDTRHLTITLREKGPMNGCIVSGENISESLALEAARCFPGLKGLDLAKEVSSKESYIFPAVNSTKITETVSCNEPIPAYNIVAYDFGIKSSILRILSGYGCKITVVPATTSVEKIISLNPEGIFLSNGPGDPAPCNYAVKAIRKLLQLDIPIFGICLGYQLLALAAGAKTLKMKYGHHGANHPVQDLASGCVMISSQNHSFTVDESTLSSNIQVTHRSLFDGTLQGIRLVDKDAFGFQGHPEAGPGPSDLKVLFTPFINGINSRRQKIT